jgi:hypothetical protein
MANSPYTVIGDSMSAGRMYDFMKKKGKGRLFWSRKEGALLVE